MLLSLVHLITLRMDFDEGQLFERSLFGNKEMTFLGNKEMTFAVLEERVGEMSEGLSLQVVGKNMVDKVQEVSLVKNKLK